MKSLLLVMMVICINFDALACKCRSTDASSQFSNADIVIRGEIIEIKNSDGHKAGKKHNPSLDIKLSAKVIQTYKGKLKAGTIVQAIIRNQGMCTSQFKDKTKMILPLYLDNKKYYAPSNCQRVSQEKWSEYLKATKLK